jgi:CheY-like chemotaxis protein
MEKKRILIIDDDVSITKVFKVIIEKTGKYEVRAELRGVRALPAAKQFKPHLILLDIMMPDLDGGEVAIQLKEDEATKDIPIVFISAAITKEEEDAAGGVQGGHPILAKPVHVTKLMECLEEYAPVKP